MTEKRYIINNNGEIENTSNHMTWDSFTEVLIILNGQSRHLEELGKENEELKQQLEDNRNFLIRASKRLGFKSLDHLLYTLDKGEIYGRSTANWEHR